MTTHLSATIQTFFAQNLQKAVDELEEGIARKRRELIVRSYEFFSRWMHVQPELKAFAVRCLSALTVQDLSTGKMYMTLAQNILPDNPDVLNNLAYVEHHVHRDYVNSMKHYKQCVELYPEYLVAYLGLSDVLHTLRLYDEEEVYLLKALKHLPQEAKLYNQLGVNQVHNLKYNDFARIDGLFLKALEVCPKNDQKTQDSIHLNRGHVFSIQGNYQDAIREYMLAIPDDLKRLETQIPHQNLLLNIHYVHEKDVLLMENISRKFHGLRLQWPTDNSSPWTALHKRFFDDMFTPKPRGLQPPLKRRSGKLRVGYVAADLYHHAVAMFSDVLFQYYDKETFEVFIYCNRVYNSDIIQKFSCTGFRLIQNVKLEECLKVIAADDVDILVDLSGHTASNRLDLFAVRPAPILLSYIAYPNNSGLEGQLRLTDAFTEGVPEMPVPQELPGERWAIPLSFLCFLPREVRGLEDIKDWKKYSPSSVVFGCFCKLPKINDLVIALWSRLLEAIPTARLVIKSQMFMDPKLTLAFVGHFSPSVQKRILCLKGTKEYSTHLDAFKTIDIHLDTFPYSGTTISHEALYMNVPVLTLCPPNTPHVHRVTGRILHNLELDDECVAVDSEYYIRKAKKLAELAPTLDVRKRMDASIIRNPEGFMKNYESTLRAIYATHLERQLSSWKRFVLCCSLPR